MNQSLILEAVNGAFFVVALAAFIVFGQYIAAKWREGYIFLRPAIALQTLWMGEAIMRGYLWYTRHRINLGEEVHVDAWIVMGSSVVTITAILCTIRVFSRESWGHWAWLITLAAIVIFVTISLNTGI